MITNGKQSEGTGKWHYIELKCLCRDNGFDQPIRNLSRLFRGITSNNTGDFYCLGCLHSFRTDNALKKHERLCDNHDYCLIEMPANDSNTLRYNHEEKSSKAPGAIYVDFECLPIKQNSCKNNPNESYTERIAIHEPCGYLLDLVSSFDSKQNSFYRGRDCPQKFNKDLKERTTKIINFKEKEIIPLTDKDIESYEKQKVCHICRKEFCYDKNEKNKFKLNQKVRDHCHYTGNFIGAAHSICNLRYKVQQ